MQGILTAIVALLLYGRMVGILGATGGAAFVALTPVITALLGIPVLGEWPSTIDWISITLISLGVYLVSGGPLPIADTGSISIENSSAWAKPFVPNNCEPRSKNAPNNRSTHHGNGGGNLQERRTR